MKTVFREFFNDKQIDFSRLTRNELIVFDTNTLLNIYRYSKNTRDTFIKSLEAVKENVWIPYQVGLEFNLNRRTVKKEMDLEETELNKSIRTECEDFLKNVNIQIDKFTIKSRDGSELKQKLKNDINNKANQLIENIILGETSKLSKLIDNDSDKINKIAEIFDGRVGESFTQEEIEKICIEGEERYLEETPPGYKDSNKNNPATGTSKRINYNGLSFESKFGDLILWKEIIEKVKKEEYKTIILVTDDHTEDWWYELSGEKIGARAELKNELIRETNADLLLINTNSFIKQTSSVKSDLINIEKNTNKYNRQLKELRQGKLTFNYSRDRKIMEKEKIREFIKRVRIVNSNVYTYLEENKIILQSNPRKYKDIIRILETCNNLTAELEALEENIYDTDIKKMFLEQVEQISNEISRLEFRWEMIVFDL